MTMMALRFWFDDANSLVTPINVGNLNQTFLVENGRGRFVLQRLNPIFAPDVNLDIDALATHMRTHKVSMPRLVATKDNALWALVENDCWRLMTFIEGENFNSLNDVEQARAAGTLVGRFHRATLDFSHTYRFTRGNPHDTTTHLQRLKEAVRVHPSHTRIKQVTSLAERILKAAPSLSDLNRLPKRHAHGDLKINNIIFGDDDTLIDLDTIGLMPWPVELGDAFRSWCNPMGENAEQVSFNENFFEAALSAYVAVAGEFWSQEEVDSLIEGILTIPLELSSRFLRDVLEDNYFGFDATRFTSRAEHNWLRANGQWALYCDIEKKRARIERVIRKAFV